MRKQQEIIKIKKEKTWYTCIIRLKTYKNIILYLPFILLSFLYYNFVNQHNLLYKKCQFKPKYNLYKAIIADTKTAWTKEHQQTNIYIVDNKSKTDLIYFHGSRIKQKVIEEIIDNLAKKTKFNIIILFYRGYGNSTGNPTEISIMTDLAYLHETIRFRNTKKILFGSSLGCAAALIFSTFSTEYDKIILENPFYNMKKVISDMNFLFKAIAWMLTDKWNSYKRIRNDDTSVQLLISEKDTLVVPENSKMLFSNHKN